MGATATQLTATGGSAAPGAALAAPLFPALWWVAAGAGAALDAATGTGGPAAPVGAVALLAHAAWRTGRPLPTASRWLTVDVAVVAAVVAATGSWGSPFALSLLAAVTLAGCGLSLAAALAASVAVGLAVGAPTHLGVGDVAASLRDTARWTVLLALVAAVAGYARSLSSGAEAERARQQGELQRLLQANALLTSLHELAQRLPASLNLDEVLDTALTSVRALLPFDSAAVLLRDDAGGWAVGRQVGTRRAAVLDPLTAAIEHAGIRLIDDLGRTSGPGASSRARLYAPLRARGTVIGALLLEREGAGFGPDDANAAAGLIEPLALAVDNARWFAKLRAVATAEERTRIARDLHDRVGQSLASLAFDLDRLAAASGDGQVRAQLDRLRADTRAVVTEVRETLHDLRSDVTDEVDLAGAVAALGRRVEARSGVEVRWRCQVDSRPPRRCEQELWRIAQEAVANAERHAGATRMTVTWRAQGDQAELVVTDDGRGFDHAGDRSRSFGLLGMRERAAAIGAALELDSAPGRGTTVRCRWPARRGQP